MSRKRYTFNAYESTLASGISASAQDIQLASVINLRAPGYLVIDPDSVTKREYIAFETINGSILQSCTRGLQGSAAGNQAHDAGIVVRAVSMHQFYDDIWLDLEAAQVNISNLEADKIDYTDHTGIDHAGLTGVGITESFHATIDHGPLTAVTFPVGTRMVFDQSSAPTGWTRDTTTVNDKMIRIVTGTRADGGTWDQGTHAHNVGSHTHSMNAHTHEISPHVHGQPAHFHAGPNHSHSIPSHSHTGGTTGSTGTTAIGQEGTGATFEYVIKAHTHTVPNTGIWSGTTGAEGTGWTGNSGADNTYQNSAGSETGEPSTANTEGSGGSTDGAKTPTTWRPSHRDMIIAVKD